MRAPGVEYFDGLAHLRVPDSPALLDAPPRALRADSPTLRSPNAAFKRAVRDRMKLLDKTTLDAEAIGECSGQAKQLRPVTITTYQMLTHRPRRDGGFPHLDLFERRDWGLVVYDEAHLLPAPVFRATARIQARRRLGLTATLIREDGAAPLACQGGFGPQPAADAHPRGRRGAAGLHARRAQALRHRLA